MRFTAGFRSLTRPISRRTRRSFRRGTGSSSPAIRIGPTRSITSVLSLLTSPKYTATAGSATSESTANESATTQNAASEGNGQAAATGEGGTAASGSAATSGEAVAEEPETVEQAPLQASKTSVIIRRGDTLWQISRRIYGKGVRYTTIYLANEDQITDPDRIIPGQVFGVPDKTLESDAEAEELHRKHVRGD